METTVYDIKSWMNFPLTFDYFYGEGCLGEEKVSVAFPSEPEVAQVCGIQIYTAKDLEGTTFSLMALSVPDSEFNLNSNVEFFVDNIRKTSQKQIVKVEFAEKKEGPYTVIWLEKNILTSMSFIRSDYFIYFFTTIDADEVEDLDYSVMQNRLKNCAFLKSFVLEAGFSFD